MRGLTTLLAGVFCALALQTGQAGSVVEELIHYYDGIETLSCGVRRDMESPSGKIRLLSRVFYRRPNHLHVQTFSPGKRRYVADGTRIFYHIEGEKKGFSRPLDDLPPDWSVPDMRIPGTALEHLERLRGGTETMLDPTDEFPVRVAVHTDQTHTVLSLDAGRRLARLELFLTADLSVKTAQYDYSQFREVIPGVFIPCLHQGTLNIGGAEAGETIRIDNLHVNNPIPADLFVAAPYFKDVVFEDDFSKIYN